MTAGWGVPLLKTHPPASAYIFSPRHRATLELGEETQIGTSGLRLQPSDRNVETKKWVLLHTHKYFINGALYTATRVTFLAQVARRKEKKFNSHDLFGFTPFEIAPTHVYIGNRRFIRR